MKKENLKIVIVGGSAGGATAATNLRRLDEYSEILIIERGPDVSYANCSLPYYFGDEVDEIDNLVVTSPKEFKEKYNIEARVREEVIDINRKEKYVEIENLESGKTYKENYDYLILSPGGNPNEPGPLQGENVFAFRNLEDVRLIDDYIKENNVEKVAVVGNGYIGIELAESFKMTGKEVSLFGSRDQVLKPFDLDMSQIIHKELVDQGINLVLGARAKETSKTGLKLDNGETYSADMLILAIGISPETTLAEKVGLEIGETKGIKVDANFRTNDEYIYAIGDAIEVHDKITGKPTMLALAGPAHKQADKAVNHIYGNPQINRGVIKSSILRVFDLNCGSVGLNEKNLKEEGIKYKYVYTTGVDKVHSGRPIHMKLLFEEPTGRILGAQIVGKGDVAKRLDVISTAMGFGGTIYDLWENELAYSPIYSTTKDITNMIASTGINYLQGKFNKIGISEVREIVENGGIFLDNRSKKAYDSGHIINSIHIPQNELRSRLDEIPRDKMIYTQSYSVERILTLRGFDNIVLVDGSYRDICTHEYFLDKKENRKPIFTEYRFY